jgi:hypothetical protein
MPVKKVGAHLTFANVVACLALFIALGGASYAAFKLPKNSVGTKQLKNGAVTEAKVKDGSLLSKDFKAGQLPGGAIGPRGAVGPQGPAGPAGTNAEASSKPLPHARIARLNSNQTITNGSVGGTQNVTFDTVVEDNAGMADLMARPNSLKVPLSGLYFVAADLAWSVVEGSGRMGGSIVGLKDPAGSEFVRFRLVDTFAHAEAPLDYLIQPLAEVIRLTAGQYVGLTAYQLTGATNRLIGEEGGTWLEATYLGP